MSRKGDAKLIVIMERKQMSESFITSVILALSGGLQDAYTYNTRNKVFSNAQTGNVVLMSQNFLEGNWMCGINYLFPIIAFAAGVFVAEQIQAKYKQTQMLHWRQGVVLLEIIILFIVGFIPSDYNMAATMLVSFSCAMQVQTFRKVNGYAYASTMCIGNLRTGTAAFSEYVRTKEKNKLKQVFYYYGIILMFALGAGIGGVLSMYCGMPTIWASCALLAASFLLMMQPE